MISHRSTVDVVGYSEMNNTRLITVNLEVPYYDLLSWLTDTDGVFDVENRPYKKDFEDTNVTPWEPENWSTDNNQELDFRSGASVSMVWEQLAKATAIAAQGLQTTGIHEDLIRKLMLPFIGRKVLITFSNSSKLLRKIKLPELTMEDDWHLPFITNKERKDYDLHDCVKLCVARCSNFSSGKYGTKIEDELKLGNDLLNNNSPFLKHIHTNFVGSAFRSNFNGWVSLPELIKNNIEW